MNEINDEKISYFLKNFHKEEVQEELGELKWLDPYLYDEIIRTHFINEMTNHENLSKCPECGTMTIKLSDTNDYEYCTECGLITRASVKFVAGQKIDLPYGILII